MDDKDLDQWAQLAAAKLVQHAVSDHSASSVQLVDEALSVLTEGTQYLVFSAAARDPSSRMYSLLTCLPQHYHTAVVAATITPTKALYVPCSGESISTLEALAALPSSPPSVLSLHSHDKEGWQPDWLSTTIRYLVHVMHRHPGLTSLCVSSRSMDIPSSQLLFPGIARLASLHCLHLGATACPFPAKSLAMLQQALPHLPLLEDLRLTLVEPLEILKRPREDDDRVPPATRCLATALSPATALTSLHISVTQQPHGHSFIAAALLPLPRLQQLAVAVELEDWHLPIALIASLGCHVPQQLTSLSLEVHEGHMNWQQLPPCSMACARWFIGNLALFSELRRLRVVLPCDVDLAGVDDDDVDVFQAVASRAPAVLASLAHLQHLSVTAESPVLYRVVSALTPQQLSALTCIDLTFSVACYSGLQTLPWPEICSSLCQMSLKQLHLTAYQVGAGGPGLSALRRLTQLCELSVTGWPCLRDKADCEVLAGMGALRQLSLVDGAVSYASLRTDDAVTALLALSSLTSLTAVGAGAQVEIDLLIMLTNRSAAVTWPLLRELSLGLADPWATSEAAVGWAVGLPSLETLAVTLPPADCTVGMNFRQVCKRLASDAGVELTTL